MCHISGILLYVSALLLVSRAVSGHPTDMPAISLFIRPAPSAEAASENTIDRRLSPEIVNELKDFLTLIPAATVDTLVAKYLITDGGFRKAIEFLRTSQFTRLLDSTLTVPEVLGVLDYVHLLDNAQLDAVSRNSWRRALLAAPLPSMQSYEMDSVNELDGDDDVGVDEMRTGEVDFVLLESMSVRKIADDRSGRTGGLEFFAPKGVVYHLAHHRRPARPTASLQSFTTFVHELLDHLPRDAYKKMIQQKFACNYNFAQFYLSLRSEVLRPLVNIALASSNMRPFVQTLAAHSISVWDIRNIAFQVISWGPPLSFNDR